MKSSNIGGQAVMEGIMMRHGDVYSVAVRKPDGSIAVKEERCGSISGNQKVKKIPIVRGVIAFADSMVIGMKTLSYSASFFEDEEEEREKIQKEAKVRKKEEKRKRVLTEEELAQKKEKRDRLVLGMTIAFSVVLTVFLFMLLPYFAADFLRNYLGSESLVAVAEVVLRLLIFFAYILLISRMKDIQRVFMYHGAEHKCINCLEHGLDLTVENVMKSSREHKRCGTSFLLFVMVVSVVFFLFIRLPSPWLRVVVRLLLVPVIAGVSYELIRLAGSSDHPLVNLLSRPGMALQHLTTKEPEEDMVEVAIVAVEKVFDWKAYLAENFPGDAFGNDGEEAGRSEKSGE